MTIQAAIAGSASVIGHSFDLGVESTMRSVVSAALAEAKMAMDDIDTVVSVASDTLDGVMIPIRAEIAGSFGKSYLNVPSSAGHALAASVALIESGQATNVLLAGWGAASRLASADSRSIQADPFYDRPSGASPAALSALQARELAADAAFEGRDPAVAAGAMTSRAWSAGVPEGAQRADAWLGQSFCDGAVALVLCRAEPDDARIRIADFGSSARPYSPQDERLDPAPWAMEAMAHCREPAKVAAVKLAVVEAAGPTSICEARVLSALVDHGLAGSQIDHWNASGGGATAWFGPATALRQLAFAATSLRSIGSHAGGVLDLAGPLGQHVTFILLTQGEVR